MSNRTVEAVPTTLLAYAAPITDGGLAALVSVPANARGLSTAATAPVSGFTRRFCPVLLTIRSRSTCGLKSTPNSVPSSIGLEGCEPIMRTSRSDLRIDHIHAAGAANPVQSARHRTHVDAHQSLAILESRHQDPRDRCGPGRRERSPNSSLEGVTTYTSSITSSGGTRPRRYLERRCESANRAHAGLPCLRPGRS